MPLSGWTPFVRSALAAAAVVVVAPVLAQNTTSAVSGRVTDAAGQPVAGASVTIVHDESRSAVSATTDADGRYAARGLRVGGPFTISFTKDGRTERREGVFLALAETLALDVTLGAPTATIVVTGQAVSERFNRANMGAGTGIGAREIAALPSLTGNLQDFARTDPRLSQTDKERGEISAGGQNSRFNSITIDGVKTNDTFGLESNNLPTARQPITLNAIQSVQVNVSNYDATQKGYTGANINAVTKSGTNEFKGGLFYSFRNDTWAGDRYNRTTGSYTAPPRFRESSMGFVVGGPIIEDRLFFFASYEESTSSRDAPSFGPLGGPLTNVGISPGLIANVASLARSAYGLDIGGDAPPGGSELEVKDTLLKVDWNISDNHRANLRYAKTEQTEPFFPDISATALSTSSHWYTQGKAIETLVGQWFADWTPSFSTELKLSRRDYESEPQNNTRTPQIGFAVTGPNPPGTPASVGTGTRTLFIGTERSRHFNVLRTKTDDAYLGANWQLGAHEIKFGLDVSRNEVFNAFLQDTLGNYTFRCINSSASFTYNFAPTVTCASAAEVEQAILENFQRGRPFSYQIQTPVAGKTLDDGVARWTLTETGAFLQDTWTLNKQLTLMAGVRVDQQSTPDRPIANAAAAAPVIAGNPAAGVRQSGGFGLDNTVTLDGEQLVQPRFGFNWAIPSERRMQLRGGFGLFQGAAANVWVSNPYSNTGAATRLVGCGGQFPPCSPAGGQFSPNPDSQATTFPGTPPAANVDFLDPALGQPAVWKANLAFESELPWYGIVAGAEWLYTRAKQAIYYQNLNLGPVVRNGSDGRELYWNAQGYNPACWSATGSLITTGACTGVLARGFSNPAFNNVLLAKETKLGGGDSLTLTLSRPARDGFSWTASYTRATAKEVSPLTSSVSNSNWAARSVFNPNEEVNANSAYLVRDRVNASLSWSRALMGNHRTTFGLFYEGRKGKPYSWTFANDLNGDGQSGNDLMYIPSAPGSGEVVFAGGATAEAQFWQVVNAYPELSGSRGSVTRRNGSFSPFTNSFDLRVAQELPGFLPKHKTTVTLDIFNIGNLLNKRWGRVDEIAFQSAGGQARSFVNYGGLDPNGRYIYVMTATEDLVTRQARGESQWAAQITLKYEF